MNGKDLLAVLAMILPGVLLTFLIAFALVPTSVTQPFPGSGGQRGDSRTEPDRRSAADKGQAMPIFGAKTAPGTATQKKMRDPWARTSYAKVP